MKSTTYTIARDKNGNKTLRVKEGDSRARSIQTNGNLPRTHRDGIGEWTPAEVAAYRTGPYGLTPVTLPDGARGYINSNGTWDRAGNRVL